jgi:hypothetical protein
MHFRSSRMSGGHIRIAALHFIRRSCLAPTAVIACDCFRQPLGRWLRNCVLMPDNAPAAGNQDLVAAARQAVEACGLAVADADTLRTRWAGI